MNQKKITLSLFLVTALLISASVTDNPGRSPKKIMNSYRGEKGFLAFSVPVFLAKIMLSKEDQDVNDLLGGIRRIRILVCGDACGNSAAVSECMSDLNGLFRDSHYVSLIQIEDNKETIEIKAIPGENCFHDLVLIASDKNEFAVIHLQGSVDLEKISNFMGDN